MTPELRARIVGMAGDGSAGQVAVSLGVTRNVVAGVWYRAGIERPRVNKAAKVASEPVVHQKVGGVGCRFIEGSPAGAATVYCAAHVGRVLLLCRARPPVPFAGAALEANRWEAPLMIADRWWTKPPLDLPPEAQGLPSDGLYGCMARELTETLRRVREIAQEPFAGRIAGWSVMSFTEARNALLKEIERSWTR